MKLMLGELHKRGRSFIFEHGGRTWNGGRDSMERLAPASMAIETGTRDVLAWGDANNQPVPLTLTDLNQLLSAMAMEQLKHNDCVYQQARAMKEHVATLTTLSDIRSFQIPYI
ncbi:MAG: DUF4376 domain-containing protein [Plesiomonas sp.]|uniref:DUF4376 domain-containing protein n=1 Tax=Plesiomonas sp. TaxID=2486279 RepID=UPI003F2C6772